MATSYSIVELRERLSALDARVQKAQDAVLAAEAALAANRTELERVQAVREGAAAFVAELDEVERNMQYHFPAETQVIIPTAAATGNKEIIADLLREFPEGVPLRHLQQIAHARRLDLNDDQVRSAVTYLGRTGRAVNIKRGWWRASEFQESAPPESNLAGSTSTSVEPATQDPSLMAAETVSG